MVRGGVAATTFAPRPDRLQLTLGIAAAPSFGAPILIQDRRTSMSAAGLPTFDETVHLSNLWLNELMAAVEWDDKPRAYRLLRTTLHALRDRLSANADEA